MRLASCLKDLTRFMFGDLIAHVLLREALIELNTWLCSSAAMVARPTQYCPCSRRSSRDMPSTFCSEEDIAWAMVETAIV